MNKIKQLPPHEAQKIAAGQVVERPANIVKELIENSIDAQATSIELHIHQAGQNLIRVIDNGYGMSLDDAQLCFERHATSKITHVGELSTLNTFGFRGEALPSIAAVSKVILITKEPTASEGIKITLNGGQQTVESVLSNTGTDITISDLFYNVPARKKFLKKPETELRHIISLFQAICLSHLAIHFKLFSESSVIYNCPGTKQIKERIAQLWDSSIHHQIISIKPQTKELITIRGAISNHQYCRYDSNHIFFFVNNRWVRNHELMKSFLKGYLNVIQPGRFPAGAIHITLDGHEVDINTHPRKEEVKFVHPYKIETVLTTIIKKTLEDHLSDQLAQSVTFAPSTMVSSPAPTSFAKPTFTAQPFTSIPPLLKHKQPPTSDYVAEDVPTTWGKPQQPELPLKKSAKDDSLLPTQEQTAATFIEEPVEQQTSALPHKEYTIIGQLHKTYILLEHLDGLFVVDQHAAHERIFYEIFKKQFGSVSSINLLFPAIIEVPTSAMAAITAHLDFFVKHGIVLEPFGEQQLKLVATPIHAKDLDVQDIIKQFIAWLDEHHELDTEALHKELNNKLNAQMACKAAVKAGDVLSVTQMHKLLDDLYACENRFICAHGRPTGWLLPTYDIEKKFKRII